MTPKDWILKKLLKTAVKLANAKADLTDANEARESLEQELLLAVERESRLNAELARRHDDTEQVKELTARVAGMAPQKQFCVESMNHKESGLSYRYNILSVRSTNGMTYITIEPCKQ